MSLLLWLWSALKGPAPVAPATIKHVAVHGKTSAVTVVGQRHTLTLHGATAAWRVRGTE